MSFLKGNVDAALASGTTVVNGMRDLTKVMLAHVHEQLETNLAYGKAALGCRSVHELMELNQKTLQSSVEGLAQTSGKMSEMSAKTAEEAVAPLTERVTVAMDRMAQAQAQPAAR
ncbi:phasin family protein [Caenispirillum salinarum]